MRQSITLDEPPFPDDPGPGPYDHPEAPEPPTPAQPPADTPPADIAAERIVIGTAITAPTAYEHLARALNPADFYDPRHELIWAGLEHLAAAGHPTDVVALSKHLTERRLVTKAGGAPYLHTLYAQAAGTIHQADYHARSIAELAQRRHALRAFQAATQRLRNAGPNDNAAEVMRETVQALNEAVDAATNPNPTSSWAPVDLEEALAGRSLDPPPVMLARDDGVCLFYDGGVHAISGESESGKTWVCLVAAVQVMTAGMAVVFIDFEDRADRVVSRLLALGATPEQIRGLFRYVRPDRPLSAVAQHELAPHLEHAALCIIDGVTEAMTMHGFEINDNGDAARFYGLIPRWIADQGPAVVMIDHVQKDAEKRGRYALGAQHKLAGIDAASYLVKVITPFGRGKRGLARIDVAKDRPGHVREHARGNAIAMFALDDTIPGGTVATLEAPDETSTTEDGSWAPTALMEKLSKHIQLSPGQSQRTIFDTVPGQTKGKRVALETLVRRGHVRIETGPRGAHFYHHVTPFPPIEYAPEDTPQDTPE